MGNSRDDPERLRRLKDQQIAKRDPMIKQRQIQREVARRYRTRERVSLISMIGDVPNKWLGLIGGFVLGVLFWILLAMFFMEKWVDLVGILAITLLTIMGFLIGQALDIRDTFRDV